jgi:glycosyltransferase involved in cell wall biosynthesis
MAVKALAIMPLSGLRGGSELMFWHLMLHGRDKGLDWIVLFFEEGPLVERVRELGNVDVRFIAPGRMRDVHKMTRAIGEIASIIRREKIGLVVGWIAASHLYGGPAAKMAGVPAVWYQLGNPMNRSKVDQLATAIPAAGVVTCSAYTARAQEAVFKPRRSTRAVHAGVEIDKFDPALLPPPAAMRAQLGIPPDGPLIGIVGRLQRWKGMHTLIEAMPLVHKTHPDARAVIVGGAHADEAEYEQHLARRIQELGLAERVQMVGQQRNVPEWTQAMDVVVHASDQEPFGLVVIEAMAMEKPLVAGSVGGPAEIITPEVNGLLAPYEDHAALAAALCRYLDDPAWAAQIGKAARQRAFDFTAEKYADNLVRAFKELAGLPEN